MRRLLIGGWILAAFIAIPLQAQSAPLRTVTYHFSIDAHGFDSSTSIGAGGDLTYGGESGTDGRTGTITLNVVAATQDGGLVVDALERVDRVDRPLQTIRCAVYENPATVLCDQNLVQAGVETEEVDLVLTYFGRGFYDASRLDNKNHWQTVESLNEGKASRTTDFTVTKTDGDVLTISVNRMWRMAAGDTSTSGTLVYDSAMTLPKSGHLVTTSDAGGELSGSTIDFQLVSDSLAKH